MLEKWSSGLPTFSTASWIYAHAGPVALAPEIITKLKNQEQDAKREKSCLHDDTSSAEGCG